MPSRSRMIGVVAAILASIVLAAHQERPRAALAGTVVDATSGKPVANVRVEAVPVQSAGPVEEHVTTTDRNGAFLLSDLSPDNYLLRAQLGWATGEYGRRWVRGRWAPVIATSGRDLSGLVVTLWPAASISGVVRDEHHRPVAGVEMRVAPRTPNGGCAIRWDAECAGRTNARGEYTIEGLTPGAFVVFALFEHHTHTAELHTAPRSRDWGPSADGLTYLTAFAPDTETPERATTIPLSIGEHRNNVDITVRKVTAHRLSGRISRPTPSEMLPRDEFPDIKLQLVRSDVEEQLGALGPSTETAGDSFEFLDVPPGRYVLRARLSAGRSENHRTFHSDQLWAELPVNVSTHDVVDLRIAMRSGTKIHGTLIVEPPATPERVMMVPLVRAVMRDDGDDNPGTWYIDPSISPQFDLETVAPGRYWLDLPSWGLTEWWLKRATLNGRNVRDSLFDVGPRDIGRLELVVSKGKTTLTGRVIDDTDANRDVAVVMFPKERDTWATLRTIRSSGRSAAVSPPRVRVVSPAPGGRFEFSHLPAGTYYIAAVRSASLDRWPSTDLMSQLARVASTVSVVDGTDTRRDLHIVR